MTLRQLAAHVARRWWLSAVPAIVLFTAPTLKSQGLEGIANVGGVGQFGSINNATGAFTINSPVAAGSVGGYLGTGIATDPANNRVFFFGCSGGACSFFTLNTQTGVTTTSAPTAIIPLGLFYNSAAGTLNCITQVGSGLTAVEEFGSVDPVTAAFTPISIIGDSTFSVNLASGFAYDRAGSRLFFYGNSFAGSGFQTINALTGGITASPVITQAFGLMQWDSATSVLYGLYNQVSTDPTTGVTTTTLEFGSISPITGAFTAVSVLPSSGVNVSTGSAIDPAGNRYFFYDGANLLTVDTQNGAFFGTAPVAVQPLLLFFLSQNRSGKPLGNCELCNLLNQGDHPGEPTGGDPITVGTGNVFETVTDYATAGPNTLAFTRSYNSQQNLFNPGAFAVTLGTNWRSNYDRYLQMGSATSVAVERADGQVLNFTLSGGVWVSDTDVDEKLSQAGGTWTLVNRDDSVETYTTVTTQVGVPVPYGRLASIQSRNGYTQTMSYAANHALQSVTDSYGRTLTFTYNANGGLQTVTTPDGTVLTYAYSLTSPTMLTSVAYSTTPATSQTYLYENVTAPSELTGVIDENGNRFATWTYDGQGRGLSSQHAGGTDLTTIVYDDVTGNRTLTNPLGQQTVYQFATLQGVPKVIAISRIATATTAAATETFAYDASGYTARQTDWNGNLTTFVNDIHGQPTTTVEAAGTAQARTTAITYHATFHLPLSIATPGLTTTFMYDAAGELLTKTLTDTTATIVPYSTNGTSRVWTYTWANFLLASAQGPRTDVTQLTSFAYDASGALTKITDALGQAAQITAHSGGGLPETIVDLNVVTTTLTYSPRQWLLTSTLSTTAGPLTTTLAYDGVGDLVTTTLPDGSALTNSYDAAHRLTGVTDLFNQSVGYTLDANGDRTQTNILNSASTAQRKHSDTFDALGRTLDDIGGVGQTKAYAYDANGNALTVTDPLAHVTQQAFDALNRLIRTIDAASGITKITYDAHDRPVTVVDPNSGSTTFVYDGFGDVIQRISPDTGKTVYRYDLAGNLTQSVDATGATTNYTYDAINRPLTTTYPADAAENVAYSYDQTGHGFGIGRLTSVTDAAGTLSRSYDERGNVLTETRVHGTATLLTSTAYNAASRVVSITYPSGWNVAYTRDAMGRITAMNAKSPAGVVQSVTSTVAYQPFGPVNAMTYGNGVAETRSFDLDYRLLNLSDTGAASLQNLTYTYDADNNVSKIADGLTAPNTQTLGYDVLDHLTGATGNYGSLGYTYSAIGNRLTQTSGGVLSNYTYAPHSNQLASIKTGTATQTITTTAAGNVSSFAPAFGTVTNLAYNQANRLATASSGTGQIAQYTYDAFGRRIVKVGATTATTLYQYDLAGHLLEENDGLGNAKVDYVYLDDRPVATIEPSIRAVYFLHDDRLGTPQLATDASQTVQWSATYQPFGTTSTGVGLIVQNLRLPGQEFDLETGLYHNGFRDYIPGLGRYAESDPIGLNGGWNTYAYVGGNPFKRIDRRGLDLYIYITKPQTGDINDQGEGPPLFASPITPIPDRDIPLPPVQQPSGTPCTSAILNELRDWTGQLGDIVAIENFVGLGADFPVLDILDIVANYTAFQQNPTLGNFLALANSFASINPTLALGEGVLRVIGVNPPWEAQKP